MWKIIFMETFLEFIVYELVIGSGLYIGWSLAAGSWSEGIIPAIVFGIVAGIVNVVRNRKKNDDWILVSVADKPYADGEGLFLFLIRNPSVCKT